MNLNESFVIVDSQLTLFQALEGLSEACPEEIKIAQRLLTVHYYSFDGQLHQGQILVHESVEEEVRMVFDTILSVIPVAEFAWSDEASMQANNSSGFNYRLISGSNILSEHAQGLAIDLNPFLNPYVKSTGNQPIGSDYNPNKPGVLTADHLVVKKFKLLGWTWGGDWAEPDYQHFEK